MIIPGNHLYFWLVQWLYMLNDNCYKQFYYYCITRSAQPNKNPFGGTASNFSLSRESVGPVLIVVIFRKPHDLKINLKKN